MSRSSLDVPEHLLALETMDGATKLATAAVLTGQPGRPARSTMSASLFAPTATKLISASSERWNT